MSLASLPSSAAAAGTSAAGSPGAQAASTPAPSPSATGGPGTVTVQRQPVAADTADSLDLISTVAMPLVKRFAPALASLLAGIIAGMLLGRRRRFIIVMTEPPRRG